MIHVQRSESGVATLTLETKTLPPAFFPACREAFEELNRDPDLRCVVVRSEQEAFSYGLDMRAAFMELGLASSGPLASVSERNRLLATIRDWQAAFNAIAASPVPVIAAVHGWCIGGGLDLVSACDVRYGTSDTVLSLREVKVAIVADLGSLQRLPGIIGTGHTRELAFSGCDVSAERAETIGLLNRVLPDREACHEAAAELAEEIAGNPPLVVRGIKDVLAFGEGKSVQAGLDYVAAWNSAFLGSRDLLEAGQAFLEKRPPVFRGE